MRYRTIASVEDKYSEINPPFEEYVTKFCHDSQLHIGRLQRKFLKRAYDINVIEHREFSWMDFRSKMSQDNYRQNIRRLRPFIEKIINTRPHFYKLKGIHYTYFVTKKPTRVDIRNVDDEFEKILASIKIQPPMMHDIRIEARVAQLFENIMLHTDLEPNPHNWAFTIRITAGNRFEVIVNLYRNNKMQVIIGCTHRPIPYHLWGFHELTALLGQVCYYLKELGGDEFYHNPIPDWIVQYLHLNKDGAEIYGKRFSYSIADLSNHSVFYLKKFKDGKFRPRYEEHQRPKKTIAELTKSMEMG